MLGIPHTVIHAAKCGPSMADFKKKNIAFYRMFEENAEIHGVDMLTENSAEAWNPEYFLRTGKEMRAFVDEADIPRLHINWDTGHANVQGCDQYTDILDIRCVNPSIKTILQVDMSVFLFDQTDCRHEVTAAIRMTFYF